MTKRWVLRSAWTALALALIAPAGAQTPAPATAAYFEFGTVVAIGQHTVDVQTFDANRQRVVQHNFALTRESRADVVRVGDTVEVIYTPGASPAAQWTVRRLVYLATGVPQPGPPGSSARAQEVDPDARVPSPTSANLGRNGNVAAGSSRSVALPGAAAGGKTPASPSSVDLGSAAKPKQTTVISTSLAAPDIAARPKPITTREVARQTPAEECNRGSADWPAQPLRLAVLDFRYPTEREEAHDIGTTGGGSGTAVADLVFSRLDALNQFAMSRGDRSRVYRADFAGAARAGRELGADAVLAGTFAPVDPPPGSDPDFPPPKSYELRAGIVDTCTGQLLLRLTSVSCPPGVDPNAAANGPSCKRLAVTAKQASDPKEMAHAFTQPIDALLYPLEHNGPPPGTLGSAGVVTAAENGHVTIRLPAGTKLQAGDQVAVHAWRLTKNPSTYTLHNLHDEEIGRVKLDGVQGGVARGAFTGEYPPLPGDTAELVTE